MTDNNPQQKIITRQEAKHLGLKFYFTGKECTHSHLSERRTTTMMCRMCEKENSKKPNIKKYQVEYQRAWTKKERTFNPMYHLKRRTQQKENRLRNPGQFLFASAKARAREQGLAFTITLEDVKKVMPLDGKCPILGIPVGPHLTKMCNGSLTLDRINPDPSLGYVPGNIQAISFLANAIKRNQTDPSVFFKVGISLLSPRSLSSPLFFQKFLKSLENVIYESKQTHPCEK